MVLLAMLLCGFVVAEGMLRRRRKYVLLRTAPARLMEPDQAWRGFDTSCGAAGFCLILLACWQFVAPTHFATGGFRLQPLVVAVTCLPAAAAMFTLSHRRWRPGLADVAMGLLTCGVAGVALLFLPSRPRELAERFPLILNAIVIALGVLVLFWVWIHGVWEQQLDSGAAWTTAGRLRGLAGRFAFTTALMALAAAWLMTVWPRLPQVAGRDAEIGRMTAGIAGHLLLILGAMLSRRRWKRSAFAVIAALAVLSLVGFVVVRVSDFVTLTR